MQQSQGVSNLFGDSPNSDSFFQEQGMHQQQHAQSVLPGNSPSHQVGSPAGEQTGATYFSPPAQQPTSMGISTAPPPRQQVKSPPSSSNYASPTGEAFNRPPLPSSQESLETTSFNHPPPNQQQQPRSPPVSGYPEPNLMESAPSGESGSLGQSSPSILPQQLVNAPPTAGVHGAAAPGALSSSPPPPATFSPSAEGSPAVYDEQPSSDQPAVVFETPEQPLQTEGSATAGSINWGESDNNLTSPGFRDEPAGFTSTVDSIGSAYQGHDNTLGAMKSPNIEGTQVPSPQGDIFNNTQGVQDGGNCGHFGAPAQPGTGGLFANSEEGGAFAPPQNEAGGGFHQEAQGLSGQTSPQPLETTFASPQEQQQTGFASGPPQDEPGNSFQQGTSGLFGQASPQQQETSFASPQEQQQTGFASGPPQNEPGDGFQQGAPGLFGQASPQQQEISFASPQEQQQQTGFSSGPPQNEPGDRFQEGASGLSGQTSPQQQGMTFASPQEQQQTGFVSDSPQNESGDSFQQGTSGLFGQASPQQQEASFASPQEQQQTGFVSDSPQNESGDSFQQGTSGLFGQTSPQQQGMTFASPQEQQQQTYFASGPPQGPGDGFQQGTAGLFGGDDGQVSPQQENWFGPSQDEQQAGNTFQQGNAESHAPYSSQMEQVSSPSAPGLSEKPIVQSEQGDNQGWTQGKPAQACSPSSDNTREETGFPVSAEQSGQESMPREMFKSEDTFETPTVTTESQSNNNGQSVGENTKPLSPPSAIASISSEQDMVEKVPTPTVSPPLKAAANLFGGSEGEGDQPFGGASPVKLAAGLFASPSNTDGPEAFSHVIEESYGGQSPVSPATPPVSNALFAEESTGAANLFSPGKEQEDDPFISKEDDDPFSSSNQQSTDPFSSNHESRANRTGSVQSNQSGYAQPEPGLPQPGLGTMAHRGSTDSYNSFHSQHSQGAFPKPQPVPKPKPTAHQLKLQQLEQEQQQQQQQYQQDYYEQGDYGYNMTTSYYNESEGEAQLSFGQKASEAEEVLSFSGQDLDLQQSGDLQRPQPTSPKGSVLSGGEVRSRLDSSHSFDLAPPSNPISGFGQGKVSRGDGRPPHALVSWGFGGRLITMFPKRRKRLGSFTSDNTLGGGIPGEEIGSLTRGAIRIFSTKDLCQSSATKMTMFPGPLVAHSVSSSGTDRAKLETFLMSEVENATNPDCGFASRILWHVLLLLVKGNGDMCQSHVLGEILETLQGGYSVPTPSLVQGEGLSEESQRTAMSDIENLLLAGDREGAVVRAVESEMWAQALVISNFVSVAAYRRVVERFTESTAPGESISRTLLLLFAGLGDKAIAPTGSTAENQLRDSWKRTLAAILSNRTPGDNEVLVSLGDRLRSEANSVDAAHVCYLVAGSPIFGSRMGLVGGDPPTGPSQRDFVTPESIQRTETYIYSQTLRNPGYRVDAFQPFRLVYAMWLADFGATEQAYEWVKSIQDAVRARSPTRQKSGSPTKRSNGPFSQSFQRQLRIFSDRLKLCESHKLGLIESPTPGGSQQSGFSSLISSIFAGKKSTHQQQPQQQQPSKAPFQPNQPFNNAPMQQPPFSQIQPPPQQQQQQQILQPPPPIETNSQVSNNMPPPLHPQTPQVLAEQQPATECAKSEESKQEKKKEAPSPPKPKPGAVAGGGFFSNALRNLKTTITQAVADKGDAVIVGDGLGADNEAYYDEKLKRWIFPGEEDTQEVAAPSAPPTRSQVQQMRPSSAPPAKDGRSPTVGDTPPGPGGPPRMNAGFTKGGARNRYVDPFAMSGQVLERPASAAPGLPPMQPPRGPNAGPKISMFAPPPMTFTPEAERTTQPPEAPTNGEVDGPSNDNQSPQ